MKGGTVQINWHDTKPVLTLDFHPLSGLLATGGADHDIKLWVLKSGEEQKKAPGVTYQTSLSYHSSAVNVLRFSPSGERLASGADGGELILWRSHSTDAGQAWKVLKSLLFHRKDVLDLQWSKDDAFLISGSVDNSCIIWDVNKGSVHQILDSHSHYVQGVAWDPLAKYAASLSSDRTCRIYVNKPSKTRGTEKMNYVCQHVISRVESQTTDESKSTRNHLFHDETLPSFFRRLEWSPDGSCLLVPAGSYKFSHASESVNTAFVFSRRDLSRPALMLPGASKPVVAVRFCPLVFKLRGSNPSTTFFKLPYRLIFAVATLNSLYIYDTESIQPIAVVAGVHYAAVTDIAWSPTAKYLALSSQDGYCTLLEFSSEELGSTMPTTEMMEVMEDNNRNPVHEEEGLVEVTPKKNSGSPDSPKMDVPVMEHAETDINLPNPSKPEREVVEDQNSNPVHKAECLVEVTCRKNSGSSDSQEMGREETEVNTPNQSKPARKRITPMAID